MVAFTLYHGGEEECSMPMDRACSRERLDFLLHRMSLYPRVSEVFVTVKATKTFSFVAFFLEVAGHSGT
jgi:hypothetical protein